MFYRNSDKLYKSGLFRSVNCPLDDQQFKILQAISEEYETLGENNDDLAWNRHR